MGDADFTVALKEKFLRDFPNLPNDLAEKIFGARVEFSVGGSPSRSNLETAEERIKRFIADQNPTYSEEDIEREWVVHRERIERQMLLQDKNHKRMIKTMRRKLQAQNPQKSRKEINRIVKKAAPAIMSGGAYFPFPIKENPNE